MSLITTAEFAALARTSPDTVRYWRHVGKGPKGFKLGRRVVYDLGEVEGWITAQRQAQTGGSAA